MPQCLFARTLSRIRWIVKIYDVKDRFLRKPFWFFLSIFSILGSVRLRCRALYILAAMDVKGYYTSVVFWLSSFIGKGRMHPFVYCQLQCRSSMSSNFLVFHNSGGISSSLAAFLFLIFLCTESSDIWFYLFRTKVDNFYIIIYYQVFQSNINNL